MGRKTPDELSCCDRRTLLRVIPPPADTRFVGVDGGLPPIDLAAPTVTRMATFALG